MASKMASGFAMLTNDAGSSASCMACPKPDATISSETPYLRAEASSNGLRKSVVELLTNPSRKGDSEGDGHRARIALSAREMEVASLSPRN